LVNYFLLFFKHKKCQILVILLKYSCSVLCTALAIFRYTICSRRTWCLEQQQNMYEQTADSSEQLHQYSNNSVSNAMRFSGNETLLPYSYSIRSINCKQRNSYRYVSSSDGLKSIHQKENVYYRLVMYHETRFIHIASNRTENLQKSLQNTFLDQQCPTAADKCDTVCLPDHFSLSSCTSEKNKLVNFSILTQYMLWCIVIKPVHLKKIH